MLGPIISPSLRKGIVTTRRALRRARRRQRAAGRLGLVGLVLFGLVVSSAPTAQAVVQTNSAVDAVVNGANAVTLTERGSKVNLKVMSPVADAGSLTQSVTQMIDPTRVILTGLQDITAPAEWTLSYTTDGTNWSTTTPTTLAQWAAVRGVKATGPVVSDGTDGNGLQISTGDATQAYPAGGSVNAAASGDGYNLFFDERGNFYNIWHHNGAGSPGIDCHTRSGARCAGAWPYTWAVGTESGPNTVTKSYGWYDPVDHEIWFSSNMKVDGVGYSGFACVDVRTVAAPGWCGGTKATGFHEIQTGGIGGSGYPGLGAVDGKLFTLNASTGDLLCLDIRADFGNGAPCSIPAISFPSYPSASQYVWDGTYGGYALPTVQAMAGRVYAYIPKAVGDDGFVCVEPSTLALCAGWTGTNPLDPKPAEFNTAHIWPLPNAQGEIQAICGGGSWIGCYNFDGTVFTGTKPPNGAVVGSYQLEAYGQSDPVVSGTKIFSPKLSGADTYWIACWDMATNAACTGINGKVTNAGLYTVNIDPYNETCIWTNTDPGVIQTWDTITGSNSCTPRSIAFDAAVVVPRMGCDASSAIHAWKSFTLTNPPASEYTSAVLTVKTEDGTNITGWVKKPLTTNSPIDLSTLSVDASGQRPKFVVEFVGRVSGGTSASAKVSAVGDSPELCLAPTVIKCDASLTGTGPYSTASLFPAETLSLTGKGDWTDGSAVLNQLTTDASLLTLPQGNFIDCASKITGTAKSTNSTGPPVAGAKVTLLTSAGTVINYPNDWPDASLRGTPVTTTTASDGTYDLGWVLPGDYKVKFEDVPTSQVNTTTVVTGSTAATKTTSETTYAVTSLASITATPVIGTNAVVDAIYKTLPQLTKKFVPGKIAAGGSGALVFEISNATGNPAWTGLGFVDTLPTGLVVAAIPNKQFTCPAGTNTIYDATTQLSATAGGSVVSATFDMNAGVASCFFSVDVTSATGGDYTNGAGNVTTTGLAPPADATLNVVTMTNPSSIPCTTALYHHESTQLYMNGGPDYSRPYKLGAVNGNITGLGFNGLDGYLYGIAAATQGTLTSGHLVRTDNKGADTDLGALTGAALPQVNIGGDMDDSGHLLLFGWTDLTKLYVVDVYTRNVTTVTLSGAALNSNIQDVAYSNGKLYGVNGQNLQVIDVATGVVTNKLLPAGVAVITGSAYMTSDGRLIVYDSYQLSQLREIVGYTTASPTVVNLGWGNYAEYSDGTACRDATPPPATRPDTSSGAKGATQTVNPLSNDIPSSMVGAALVPSSVKLCDTGQVAPNCNATQLTKPEGTYSVNNNGEIVFVPNSSFSGVAGGVTYQVTDNKGEASTGTYTPTTVAPPAATNDTTSGAYLATQTINPVLNDTVGVGGSTSGTTLVQNSVRLCGGSDVAPDCTQTEVVIAGQGKYTVNTTTGVITWIPVVGFSGPATPVTYSVTDSLGQKATATYTPTSNAAPQMSKSFVPAKIAPGGTSTLVITLTNTTGNPAWTGLGFVDTLPSGVVVASVPNLQSNCGAGADTLTDNPTTLTATAGSSTVTVAAAGITSGVASCVFKVDVTSSTAGSYSNSASNISSTTVMPPTSPAVLTVATALNTTQFFCANEIYHSDATQLYVNAAPNYTNALKVGATRGTASAHITGLGFNGLDGYLYGIANGTGGNQTSGHLMKISSTGATTDLGALTGVALPDTNIGGDMDDSGHLLLWSSTNTTKLYSVDVYTREVTVQTLNIAAVTAAGATLNNWLQDFAYYNGKLYSAYYASIIVIDVATGVMTIKSSGTTNVLTTSAYATSDGRFIVYDYNASKLREFVGFTGSTVTMTDLGTDFVALNSDGTACHDSTPPPAPRPDTSFAAKGAAQTINPLTNDIPSSMVGATLVANSVKLCDTGQVVPNCTATSLTKPEGTYTVKSDGSIEFVPNPTFTGVATGVTYQVTDSQGEKAGSTYTPTVVAPPAAVNDVTTGAYMAPQTVNPITATGTADSVGVGGAANGVTLDQGSVRLCGASDTSPICTATEVVVAGKGKYTVNTTTGVITWTPDTGFAGNPPAVVYSVTDSLGQKAAATYTPTTSAAPRMSKQFGPDSIAAGGVTSLTFTITNTSPAAAWTGLAFVDVLPSGVTVDTNPNVTKTCTAGTVTASASSGTITVTGVPLTAAEASCTITVEVKIANTGSYTNGESNISSTTVMPPTSPATVVAKNPISPGSFTCNPYVFTALTGGKLMVQNPITGVANQIGATSGGELQGLGFNGQDGYLYAYVRAALATPPIAAGHIVKISAAGVISDLGVATIGGAAMGAWNDIYSGDMDDSGNLFLYRYNTSAAYFINVNTMQGRAITLSAAPGVNFQDFAFYKGKFYAAVGNTIGVITPSDASNTWNYTTKVGTGTNTAGAQMAAYANSAEFLYVSSGTGFSLVNNIDGSAVVSTLSSYTQTGQMDGAGCHQATGLYTPAAVADTITTAYNTAQVYTPLSNDIPSLSGSALNPASVKLCDTAQTAPNCTLTTKTVSGQGTYTVNTTTGAIDFVPLSSFTGTATPVTYQLADMAAKTASATITPVIGPPPAPTATNDTSINGQGITQTVNPLTNDTVATGFTLDATSVKLCAVGTTTNCNLTTLTVSGEGTYTVNPTTGEISFAPVANFVGTATPVIYSVTDSSGQKATATYTPRVIGVPNAADDTSTGAWDVNQIIRPLLNDSAATGASLTPTLQGLCAQGVAAVACTSTTLTVANQGTYTLNSNGTVTFDPLPSFTGTATSIQYVATDSIGQRDSALITVSVSAAAAPEATPETKTVIPGGTVSFTTLTGTNGLATSGGPAFETGSTCLLTPGSSTCDADGVVTIAGEGTYTLNQSTGVVTFVAAANATAGTKTPISYKVVDVTGATAVSTLTPSIPAPPTVNNDTISGQLGSTLTVPLLSNDAPGSAAVDLVPSSIRICAVGTATSSCNGTSVTTPEGTFTLNTTTGVLTFTPDPAFTGTLPAHPAVKYVVADQLGQVGAATATVTILPPPATTAVSDTANTGFNSAVVVHVTANDSPGTVPTVSAGGYTSVGTVAIDNGSVRLCDPATSVCTLTSLTVPGEGVYQVNTLTGDITFTPDASFTGTPVSAPTYKVCNSVSGTWAPSTPPSTCSTATLTVTVAAPSAPNAVNDAPTAGAWDATQVINVLANDTKDPLLQLDPTTVHLCGPTQSAPNCTLTTRVVPNVGTYTVDPVTGAITFDPLPSFSGTAPAVTYQVADTFGQVDSGTLTTSVSAPAAPTANNASLPIVAGTAQAFPAITSGSSPLATGTQLQPLSTFLCAANETAPNCTATSVTVANVGTYSIDQATGVVTLTSLNGTTTASSIDYVVTDVLGQTDVGTLSASPVPAPTVVNDTVAGAYDQTKVIDVLANDTAGSGTSLDPATVKLCATGETPAGCSATQLVVPNVGTYTVLSNGSIEFNPLATFTGTAPDVRYQVSDLLGQTASATLATSVTTVATSATNDAANGLFDTNIVFTPTSNDSPGSNTNFGNYGYTSVGTMIIDPTSVRLCGLGEAAPSCSQTTLTTADGVYTVNTVTGAVTFNPDPDFFGSVTQPVDYQVCNQITGNWNPAPAASCDTATLTATTAVPVHATGVADSPAATWDVPTTFSPLANDTVDPKLHITPSSLFLCGPTQTAPSCTQTTLTVAGEGTYTVNQSTGAVTFDPLPTFIGTATPVAYQATDSFGQNLNSTITPVVAAPALPALTADTSSGGQGLAQSINILSNDTSSNGIVLDPASIKLCAPGESAPNCSVPVNTDLVVAGVGTYRVDSAGALTFTPDPVFSGTPSPVTYQITDSASRVSSSTVTPTVLAAPAVNNDVATGQYNTPLTINVLANDNATTGTTLAPSTLKIFDPATQTFGTTPVVVANQGTYSIANGQIVFTPVNTFDGVATPVTYQVADALGVTDTATVTPTVSAPNAPVASDQTKIVGPTAPAQFSSILGIGGLALGTGLQVGSTQGPAFVCPIQGATTCNETTVVIPGEGTWSLNRSTGVATFTLAAGVPSGTALTPVNYIVTDIVGQTDTGTLTPQMGTPPTLTNDTATAAYGSAVTKNVLTNDSAAGSNTLAPATLKIFDPASQTFGTTPVTIAGEGTYTVSGNNIVFTPVNTFDGAATPVTYQVADNLGTTATANYTPTVQAPAAPTATSQSKLTSPSTPAVFTTVIGANGLGTGTGLQSGATDGPVFICPTGVGATCTETSVVIPGQGTWTMDQTTGVATFTMASGVAAGTALTPVTYEITDIVGQSAQSTLTPLSPAAPVLAADTSTGSYDTNQTKNVLSNDTPSAQTTLNTSSVKLLDPTSNTYGTSVTTSEGTYTVSGSSIVFDPVATFAGTVTQPVTYRVADSLGTTSTSTYTPTVFAPVAPSATPETVAVGPAAPAVFSNIIGLTPTAIPLAAGTSLQSGATNGPAFVCPVTGATTCNDTTVVIPGQGTWSMNQSTGVATFTLAQSVTSATALTPISYEVTDIVGQTARSTLTPLMTAAPTVAPDASYGQQGDTQMIPVLGNDLPGDPAANLDPASVTLSCPPCSGSATVSSSTVTIPGEGVYTVLAGGIVRFVPEAGFTGAGTTLTYTVLDQTGQSATSTFQATVWPPPAPTAVTDVASAPYGQPVTMSPWLNDSPGTSPAGATEPAPEVVANSVRLCAVGETVPNCSATSVTTDDGTYVVDSATGKVTFTPVARFFGTVTSPVSYQIANNWTGGSGIGYATAALVPTIAPPGSPAAVDDTVTTSPSATVTITPLANDVAGTGTLDSSTLVLCDSSEIAPNCSATSVTVNTGVFAITAAGQVTFTPNEHFDLTHPATVIYVVSDSLGNSTSANIVVNDPPDNPVAQALDNLAHTGLNALAPLPTGVVAAVVGVGILYYSRQKLRAVAVSANSVNMLRESLNRSYSLPVKDYAAIVQEIERNHQRDYSDYRPD